MDGKSGDRFSELVLPHLDAAYNLARWMTRDGRDAEDAVQESALRALKAIDTFRGVDARAWVLKIVRNTCCTLLARRGRGGRAEGEEALHAVAAEGDDPAAALQRSLDVRDVRAAIEQLPPDFREVIVLREIEGLSYREIADVVELPVGTVMSRLSRGRERLAISLRAMAPREDADARGDPHGP